MPAAETFLMLAAQLMPGPAQSYVLAELNDLLTAAAGEEIAALPEPAVTDLYLANYLAAMVEMAAHRAQVTPPEWTMSVPRLPGPVFAVPFLSLRAHLLLNSPIPFRRRNIFIDSPIGDRV
jgi:hypothetical protein